MEIILIYIFDQRKAVCNVDMFLTKGTIFVNLFDIFLAILGKQYVFGRQYVFSDQKLYPSG